MILHSREKVILLICLATIAAAGLYVAVLEPVYKKWNETTDELRAKQTLLEKSLSLIAHKKELQKQFDHIQALVGARGNLEEYAGRFLLQMEQAGRQAGVKQITSMNPLPPKEEKEYELLQAQINFETDIGGLTRYLYALTAEKYLATVEKLQIDGSLEDPGTLKCQLVVSTIYLSPPGKNK